MQKQDEINLNPFLQRTQAAWQPLSSSPLTLEDAREIGVNMTALFKCLARLDKKYAHPKPQSSAA